jgi:TRAP-type uncharacterized transport system substrate-binding protein
MATGEPDGAYHRFGLKYREVLERHGIELELRTTVGSIENLELLRDPDSGVDVALMQGGVGSEDRPAGLNGLASVFYEPLWFFQREEIPVTLDVFEGLRLAIGEPGSGTYDALDHLLENNELLLTAFEAVDLGGSAAADALLSGQVDVACFVASIEAPYIQRLLLADGIHLTSFVRAEAYTRRYHFLARVMLPRGTADLGRDIPSTDIQLLAQVASLAARETLHPTIVLLLIQAATEVHSNGGIFENEGQFPSVYNTTFPINRDARRYIEKGPPWLQRYLPFWVAVAVDRLVILLIPLATLLFPLFKIAPPTYRWRIRSRIYTHYKYLFDVEAALAQEPSLERMDDCLVTMGKIEDDLGEINVPLSYADQMYQLRMHVRFVRQRVSQAREKLLNPD